MHLDWTLIQVYENKELKTSCWDIFLRIPQAMPSPTPILVFFAELIQRYHSNINLWLDISTWTEWKWEAFYFPYIYVYKRWVIYMWIQKISVTFRTFSRMYLHSLYTMNFLDSSEVASVLYWLRTCTTPFWISTSFWSKKKKKKGKDQKDHFQITFPPTPLLYWKAV